MALHGIRADPFTVELGAQGHFGSSASPRVVWLALAGGVPDCAALAGRVESVCRGAGLEPEERPFRPHVTLARARGRRPAQVPALPYPPRLEPWVADHFVLYESRLGRDAARYATIEEFRLAA